MNKLSNNILETIHKKKITPLPKALFFLKNAALWLLFALTVLLGGAALSVLFYALLVSFSELPVSFFTDDRTSRFELFLTMIPMIWILLFSLFSLFAFFLLRHTKHGYRFSWWALMGINLLMSTLLALGFFLGGGAERLEQMLMRGEGIFVSQQQRVERFLQHPEEGRLGGVVLRMGSQENTFLLQDPHGATWLVRSKNPLPSDLIGKRIALRGERLPEGVFLADEIHPAPERRGVFRRRE